MVLNERDNALIAAIQGGLPLVPRPYAAVADQLGWQEAEVLEGIDRLQQGGLIKRFGVVVRHRALGYTANAMVVWDVPDGQVSELGRTLAGYDCVTLCYRRERRLPDWPYNLFSMFHGRERDKVLRRIDEIVAEQGLGHLPRRVLFSNRCFKQRGAKYR
jgi:DNA-binding Lrp family transcriptional regulator